MPSFSYAYRSMSIEDSSKLTILASVKCLLFLFLLRSNDDDDDDDDVNDNNRPIIET